MGINNTKLKICISKCCCCCVDLGNRLDGSLPTPTEGSPGWILMLKKGVSVNLYNRLWRKYTRKNKDLQWPIDGTFDLQKLQYLQQCLLERKARQAMFEQFKIWEQHARTLAMKERKEQERTQKLTTQQRAAEYSGLKIKEAIKQADREFRMNINKCF